MNRLQRAEQLRRALQLFAQSLTDEETIMEIPAVFDEWTVGVQLKKDQLVTYGINSVGDPQLYRVIQPHVTAEDWTPPKTPALFRKIGLDPSGYPIWSQPAGAEDAYNKGDIVSYENQLYISIVDANVWRPDVYGWEQYEEGNS